MAKAHGLRWIAAGAFCAIFLLGAAHPSRAAQPRDFVFFMSSDPHVGTENLKSKTPVTADQWDELVRQRLKQMIATVGEAYPKIGPLADLPSAKVALPLGYIIAGDLTDRGDDPGEWPRFEATFPPSGIDQGLIPLYLGAGNHDGSPAGATRRGVVARNKLAAKAGRFDAIADNGLHYAWTWQGVHFVCVNLCPADTTSDDPETLFRYGKPGPGSWNDPLGALAFLGKYLHEKVGSSGEPVIVWSHYGYCEGFNFDWNWWTAKQRRAFYDLIAGYNVVALLHGHTHAAAHYHWPDEKENPREFHRIFGDAAPPHTRSFEVFSGGSMSAGTFYVFRIVGDRMIAAHRTADGWSQKPEMESVKSLLDSGSGSPVSGGGAASGGSAAKAGGKSAS